MGTTVFRIRMEVIFRRCWNLVTPSRSCRGSAPNVGRATYLKASDPLARAAGTPDSPQIPPRPASVGLGELQRVVGLFCTTIHDGRVTRGNVFVGEENRIGQTPRLFRFPASEANEPRRQVSPIPDRIGKFNRLVKVRIRCCSPYSVQDGGCVRRWRIMLRDAFRT